LYVFVPLFAFILGAVIALIVSLWLSWPRELIIGLSFVVGASLTLGPYIWLIVRSYALGGDIPVLWTDSRDDESIHLSWFSPAAWERLRVDDFSLVAKSSFRGDVHVGTNLRKEMVSPRFQTEEVSRHVIDGTWRGALDWYEFEVTRAAFADMWDKLAPRARRAAQKERQSASRSLDLALDQSAAMMSGIEKDVLFDSEAVDGIADDDLDDLLGEELGEIVEESRDGPETATQRDVDQAAAEAVDVDDADGGASVDD